MVDGWNSSTRAAAAVQAGSRPCKLSDAARRTHCDWRGSVEHPNILLSRAAQHVGGQLEGPGLCWDRWAVAARLHPYRHSQRESRLMVHTERGEHRNRMTRVDKVTCTVNRAEACGGEKAV